ncbi:MAG: hypothetical protein IK064_01190, partial [Clostridia bacterium]|nr:hypothetical protein [Clostridia bacterium]
FRKCEHSVFAVFAYESVRVFGKAFALYDGMVRDRIGRSRKEKIMPVLTVFTPVRPHAPPRAAVSLISPFAVFSGLHPVSSQ